MDRLEAMSTFLAVVEHGSLSAASRRLKTPLATVSRKISELESHLRTQLFNRSSRKLVLTDAGSSYLVACKRILADVTEAERAAAGEYAAPTGELVVTAPVVFGRVCLIPILVDFLKAYPDIDVSLVLDRSRAESLAGRDRCRAPHRRAAGQQHDCDPGRRCSPRGLRQSHVSGGSWNASHPEDLAGHDCISFAAFSVSPDVWTFVRDKTNVAVPVHARLVVGNIEAACDAACAGIGITVVGSHLVRTALERGALTTLLDEFQPAPLPVHLVYTANRFLPIKVRAFLDFAAPRLRQVFAE